MQGWIKFVHLSSKVIALKRICNHQYFLVLATSINVWLSVTLAYVGSPSKRDQTCDVVESRSKWAGWMGHDSVTIAADYPYYQWNWWWSTLFERWWGELNPYYGCWDTKWVCIWCYTLQLQNTHVGAYTAALTCLNLSSWILRLEFYGAKSITLALSIRPFRDQNPQEFSVCKIDALPGHYLAWWGWTADIFELDPFRLATLTWSYTTSAEEEPEQKKERQHIMHPMQGDWLWAMLI